MNRTRLKDFLERSGMTQTRLAEIVGVSQSAVWQMLNSKRELYVVEDTHGRIEIEEVKRRGKATAA